MPEGAIDENEAARPAFSLALDRAGRPIFLALVVGHLLYVAGMFAVAPLVGDNGLAAITPFFGAPLLFVGNREGRVARALIVLLGFPLVHYAAIHAAQESLSIPFSGKGFTDSLWLCGAIGGAIGALGSFGLCALSGQLRAGARAMIATGTAVLVMVGAIGIELVMSGGPGSDTAIPFLWLYTPWQLAFAYFLAKTLRA